MTPIQARKLAASLMTAADEAETHGLDQIDLLTGLRAADDAARADLDAAIKSAESET